MAYDVMNGHCCWRERESNRSSIMSLRHSISKTLSTSDILREWINFYSKIMHIISFHISNG